MFSTARPQYLVYLVLLSTLDERESISRHDASGILVIEDCESAIVVVDDADPLPSQEGVSRQLAESISHSMMLYAADWDVKASRTEW